MFSFKANKEEMNKNYNILSPGVYEMRVADAIESISKETKRYQIILDVEPRNNPDDISFRHFLTFIPEGEKGHGIVIHTLKALGLPYDGNLKIKADDFKGLVFKAKIGIRENVSKGRTYENNCIDDFISTDDVVKTNGVKTKDEDDIPF